MSESPTRKPVARASRRPVPRKPREETRRPVPSSSRALSRGNQREQRGDPPKGTAKRPVAREPRRCSHHTRAGRPCRAWAIHGTDPPTCSAHAGRSKGGAPRGNQNARKHGFYSRALSPDELADLLADADLNLDAEIVCARIALRRVLQYLSTDPGQLSAADHVRALALVFHGARTIARLLRDFHALGGDIDRFEEIRSKVLDDMSKELGIDL